MLKSRIITPPAAATPIFDDPSTEDESDVSKAVTKSYQKAVVTGTDWTTETILSQLRRGNIDLNPRFQRRDAWTNSRKSRFVESLFLGLPVPQLVLAERPDRLGTFLVLDGKQRLLTLLQFAGIAKAPDGALQLPLVLSDLEVLSDLNGMTLREIEASSQLADDLNAFLNRTIRTAVVRSWPNEDLLYLVFLRLNSETVPLSPQELRQALHPGPFADFLDDFTIGCRPLQAALRLTGPDFRMRDIEVLLRFYAFDYFVEDYRGNLKKFLDETVKALNRRWPKDEQRIRGRAGACAAAIETTIRVFSADHAFATFTKSGYERRFNRAVFDIMTFYFKDPKIATLSIARAARVKEVFKDLCGADPEFLQSLQSTTKSIDATRKRLRTWGKALGSALRRQISLPSIHHQT